MHKGPEDTTKQHRTDVDEHLIPSDQWADILRKTFIVAVIAITVWGLCVAMRGLVGLATDWLFATADTSRDGILRGGAVILLALLVTGALRGLLLLRPAWQDTQGDGIDRALARFHETYQSGADVPPDRYSKPTFTLAIRKLFMTTLTIGGGGSGGLEAPGVYVGEAVGAGWSQRFRQPSADELRLYQLTGIAAAIGTLLAAPFAAALFATELVYAGRIIYRKLAYCLLAAVIAYELGSHLLGFNSLFHSTGFEMSSEWQVYLLVILVAVGFSAPAAIALGPTFRFAEKLLRRLPIVIRSISGGLIAGVIALVVWYLFDLHPKHILGIGEATIDAVAGGSDDAALSTWWILLLAVVAKTLATAATVKSGGSVGMLFPSMYMGGLVGASAYYLLGEMGLYAGPTAAVFVATGMAAALTSIAGVPLASIALVIEVFGASFSPAAALACAVCFTASHRFSLYRQHESEGKL